MSQILVFLTNLIHLTNHIIGKFYPKESKKLVLIVYLFYCLLFGILVLDNSKDTIEIPKRDLLIESYENYMSLSCTII